MDRVLRAKYRDLITVNAKGYADISMDVCIRSDMELVNNKLGWESLGIVGSSLF